MRSICIMTRPEGLVAELITPSFEQLTNGLGAEAQAALYTVAKLRVLRTDARDENESAQVVPKAGVAAASE